MSEPHVDHAMSAALDGALGPAEAAAFRAHLGRCRTCAEEFRRLEAAVGALRGRGVEPLGGAAVASLVDAALPAAAPRRRPWPLLLVTHAAAAAAGLGLMWWSQPEAPTPEPSTEFVRVEVPVEVVREVPVEVIREVPVEVVVTQRVEVPVERIVREVVERPVPHPLQARWDEGLRLARAAADLAGAGAGAVGRALERSEATLGAPSPSTGGESVAATVAGPEPPPRSLAAAPRRGDLAAAAALVVRRDGERVSLTTRGTVDEVVPALIGALDGDDPAVAAAALDRLEALRSELDGGPGASGRAELVSFREPALDPVDRAGGIRGLIASGRGTRATPDEGDLADRWRAWWRDRPR